jgi:hypothetical protein
MYATKFTTSTPKYQNNKKTKKYISLEETTPTRNQYKYNKHLKKFIKQLEPTDEPVFIVPQPIEGSIKQGALFNIKLAMSKTPQLIPVFGFLIYISKNGIDMHANCHTVLKKPNGDYFDPTPLVDRSDKHILFVPHSYDSVNGIFHLLKTNELIFFMSGMVYKKSHPLFIKFNQTRGARIDHKQLNDYYQNIYYRVSRKVFVECILVELLEEVSKKEDHKRKLELVFQEAKKQLKKRRRAISKTMREARGKRPKHAKCEHCKDRKPPFRCRYKEEFFYFCSKECQHIWWKNK